MRSRPRRTTRVLDRPRSRAERTAARVRRSRLARRVALRRCVAVLLAAAVGWAVTGSVEQARRDQARWGPMRRVVVATEQVAAGEVLDADNTALEDRPAAMLPDGALDALPGGRRSSVDVPTGEPVLDTRLASATLGPLAARLPEGTAGVTLPRDEVQPMLEVGDRVDVYTAVDDLAGSASARVADAATVVHVDAGSVTVAVDRSEARGSAAAAMSGAVVLVVLR